MEKITEGHPAKGEKVAAKTEGQENRTVDDHKPFYDRRKELESPEHGRAIVITWIRHSVLGSVG